MRNTAAAAAATAAVVKAAKSRSRSRSRSRSPEGGGRKKVEKEERYEVIKERFERDDDHVYDWRDERRRREEAYMAGGLPPAPTQGGGYRKEMEIEIRREKERIGRSPSPPRVYDRPPPARPGRYDDDDDRYGRRPASAYGRRRDPSPPYGEIPGPGESMLPPPRYYGPPPAERETEVVFSRRRSRSRERRDEWEVEDEFYSKPGRTRLPKKWCSVRAVVEMGYPFVEEVRSHMIGGISDVERWNGLWTRKEG